MNLLEWHWFAKPCRLQVCNSVKHDLHTVSFAHRTKQSLFPSLFSHPFCPPSSTPHPLLLLNEGTGRSWMMFWGGEEFMGRRNSLGKKPGFFIFKIVIHCVKFSFSCSLCYYWWTFVCFQFCHLEQCCLKHSCTCF